MTPGFQMWMLTGWSCHFLRWETQGERGECLAYVEFELSVGQPSVQWIAEYKDMELRDVWSRGKTWGFIDTWTMPVDVRQVTSVRELGCLWRTREATAT